MSDFATLRRPTAGTVARAEHHPGLLWFSGPDGPVRHVFALSDGLAVLGREDTTDLQVEDHSVSRRHALLEVRGAATTIADAGSANGVFVNGVRVRRQTLVPGDLVRVGDSLLRYLDAAQDQDGHAPVEVGMAGGRALATARGLLTRAADSTLTVLVIGETGTGKELAARLPHDAGPRRDGPFVPVNCAALPGELIEAELFGAVRGAFTGADEARGGLIRAADGGTLFLDEVGEMPLSMQAKLLRFLEDHEVRAVGASEATRVDVRVVAATNADLEARVEAGRFRNDLYARLARIVVELPPLRARIEDVPILVQAFLRDMEATDRVVDPDAMERLCLHAWPRNIRELRAAVERAVFLAESSGLLCAEHFASSLAARATEAARITRRPDPEAEALQAALREAGGDVEAAASRLGIGRSQLYRRAQRLGIKVADYRQR